jgi:hypothetical protein
VIDWTKPVKWTDGTPVRVERVLADGSAIVSWFTACGTVISSVHWSACRQPVEFTDGTPVHVERVLADGTVILSWVSSGKVVQAAVCSPFNGNVRPKPREGWVHISNLRETDQYPGWIHVREVLP